MQANAQKKLKNCSGNILFIILISVGLFGALTYTIARSSRTASYSKESDDHAKVQEVLAFAEKINSAITRLHFQNNCRTSQVSFEHPADNGYFNSNSPASQKCQVFSHEGGGIKYITPPRQLLDSANSSHALFGEYLFSGNVCFDNIGTGSANNCSSDNIQNEELAIFLPWVTESVCMTINAIMGNPRLIENSGSSFDNNKFNGTFSDGHSISDINGNKVYNIGCFRSAGSPPGAGYHFYYILLEK